MDIVRLISRRSSRLAVAARRLCCIMAAGFMICAAPGANATLIGDEITFQLNDRTPRTSIVGGGPEHGVSFDNDFQIIIDLGASSLDLLLVSRFGNQTFDPFSVALKFSDLNWVGMPDGEIRAVNVVEAFDLGNFVNNVFDIDLTGPNSFNVTFSTLAFGDLPSSGRLSDTLRLEIVTAHTPVTQIPEPGAIALFAFGLAGLGFSARKRRTTQRPNASQALGAVKAAA